MGHTRRAGLFLGVPLAAGLMPALVLSGCQSRPDVSPGIQTKYAAINPTRILAVTPMAVSVPRLPGSVIEPSVLKTLPIVDWVEAAVVRAFVGQPSVNGVSYASVRKALEASGSKAANTLVGALTGTIGALQRPGAENRGLVSQECFARRDFLGFYSLCLTQNPQWKKGLNELSAAVLNADAALMVFITELRILPEGGQERASLVAQVLLLDTNNAELIWSGEARSEDLKSLPQGPGGAAGSETPDVSPALIPAGARPAEHWKKLIDLMLGDSFWQSFPGRRPEGVGTSPALGPTKDKGDTPTPRKEAKP